MLLPRNARGIIDLRLKGKRPADPVIVSFAGPHHFVGPSVFAEGGVEYDWRFLHDLDALIVVRPGVDANAAIAAIFAQVRMYPTLVDLESEQAASITDVRPVRLWAFRKHGPDWREMFP